LDTLHFEPHLGA